MCRREGGNLNIPRVVNKVWNDPVGSKVIATGIIGSLVWIGQHFGLWFTMWSVPGWLLGLLVVIALAPALIVLTSVKRSARATATNSASLKTSPILIVKCPDQNRNLIITNDSPNSALNVELGPLVHEEEHEITPATPFGSISAKATEQRRVIVAQRQPNSGGSLWDAMRYGCMLPQPSDSVTVRFDDAYGNKFAQSFELTSEVDGSVTWKPAHLTLR
jgi:hypothetical protein